MKNFYEKDFLSLDEASSYTGFSKSWLYQLCHKRAIPYYKPGKKKSFFRKSDLDRWMMSNRQASSDEVTLEKLNELSTKKSKLQL